MSRRILYLPDSLERAAINSIGNLAGFRSPYLIGVVKDATGEATDGLYVIAAFMLAGAGLVLVATRVRYAITSEAV